MNTRYKLQGLLLVTISSIAWGFMPVFTKFLYAEGWTTNSVLFFRYFIALMVLTGYLLYKKSSFRISLKQYIYILLIGIPGYIGTSYLLYSSYHYTSVGLSTMLHFIYPVLVMVMMILFFKEKFNWMRGMALIVTMAGLYLLIGVGNGVVSIVGISLALLSGLTYAVYVTGLSRTLLSNVSPFVLSFYFILNSVIVILIPIIIKNDFVVTITITSITSILFISLFATVVAVIAFIEGVKHIGSSNAAMLNTLEPIISVIAGIIIFNEAFSFSIFAGCVLIVSAIYIIARKIE